MAREELAPLVAVKGLVHQQQPTVCSTEAPLYNLSSCPPKKRFRPRLHTSNTKDGGPVLPAKKRVQAFQFGEECFLLHEDDNSSHCKHKKAATSSTYSVSCRFCHAGGDSEEAGPLMEYHNRGLIPVAQEGSGRPKAVYVHVRCAEWAPNVYYVTGRGDVEADQQQQQIRNVQSEISRAHRLKCHACGSRGAALGCCVQQCRKSFHYGCARRMETEGRWQTEEYLFLCSEHASYSFPGETPGGEN